MPKKKIKPVFTDVSEREQRLRELTDQSLQLLDQLAEARTQLEESREETESAAGELEILRQQINHLESSLRDSRRRVRTTRSVRSVGRAAAEPGDIDVVYWVPQTQAVDEDRLKSAVAAVSKTRGVTCTLVCPPDLDSAPLEGIDGLTLLAADSPCPGHVFNLAVVSTDAPLVLIVALGVDLAKSALTEQAGLSDESVGFGIPRIEQEGVEASMGLVEIEDLELARCPVARVDAESGTCDFAAPEAFFVRRAAFQQVGAFDEDLHGPAVLTDYSLRLRQASYRLQAMPDCVVSLPAGFDLLPELCIARDRVLVIARHRYEDLSTALSKSEEIGDLPADDFESLMQSLFVHLPGATPESTALYASQVRSLSRGAGASDDAARQHILDICDALQTLHLIPCQQVSKRLAEISRQLQETAEVDREGQAHDTWAESIRTRIQLELEIKGALVEAYDSLTHRTKGLAAEVKARDTQIEGLDVRLQDRSAHLADREAQLKEFYGRVADRDKQVADRDEQIAESEAARAKQETRLATLSSEVKACQEQLRGLDAARGGLVRAIETGCQVISPGLSIDMDCAFEELEAHIHSVSATMTERHEWILALLDELCSKRLSLRSRKLAPHERDFIDLYGQDKRQSDE